MNRLRLHYHAAVPHLAYLMLSDHGTPPDSAGLKRAWSELWPDEAPLNIEQSDDGVLVFPFEEHMATVSHMPGPYAWPDLEGPAQAAWHWPEAAAEMRAHARHVLVGTVSDAKPSVALSIRNTMLMAAAIRASTGTVGVYWPNGTAVSPADRFLDGAQTIGPENLPILNWIEFRVWPSDGGTWNLYTTGLSELGLMEIEVRDSRLEPEALIDRIYDIAHYLCMAGPILRDGETIGGDDGERISIRHLDSIWDRPGPVLVLAV